MAVPWLGYKVEYETYREEIEAAIRRVLESGEYQRGGEVEAFEEEFARFCGARSAIGTGSCYGAMLLGLLACGVGAGDEVITVSNTDITCTAAITHAGASIVLADVDARTHNIDPQHIVEKITPRTKAILVVHMYGLPADMDPIMDIASQHSLYVIEDAALAAGARYGGRRAGTIGHVGCFSFVYGKGLGAYGDAGMAVTDDPELGERIRSLNMYNDSTIHYERVGDTRLMTGFNYLGEGQQTRLIPLHAAVLRGKLKHLDGWVARRRAVAEAYRERLADLELVLPWEPAGTEHAYRNFTVRAKDRDRVRRELARRGIPTGAHYIPPLHLQPVYRRLGYGPGSLPVTERLAGELFTLPMYPELTEDQVEEVAVALRACVPAGSWGQPDEAPA